ncbi:hypothetical protein JMA_18680 [Jeotgalibacillus malaysiensis]|uniref:Competence protein ComK n=1 Tax=Jeotgalibacillus malaysiensis TaxID=1508404 RepID=A0A0B5ALP9_9BACL|nr:hypothetical protein [Jeotgalibacillus malaysiensis]AJD91185.1 hypothetical protein JMA_18680 [Jeotgalibacillus malaysiensis]
MFDERAALKIRLEQLADSEIRILREFRQERENIMLRLRELDQSSSEIHSLKPSAKPINVGKSKKMHTAALNILQKKLAPVKGTDIQHFVEQETGYKVANITTFMNTIQRKFSEVRKLDRGLYIYEKE